MTRTQAYEILIKFWNVDSQVFFSKGECSFDTDDFEFENFPEERKDYTLLHYCIVMLNQDLTLCDIEDIYCIPHTTLHRFIHQKLPGYSQELYALMKEQFKINFDWGHRKGIVTKRNKTL